MRPMLVLRIVAVLVAVLGLATATSSSALADDPPWSPAGFELAENAPFTIDGESRCPEGEQWTWTTESTGVGLILLPCSSEVAARAVALIHVRFSSNHPDEQVLGVERVTWDSDSEVSLRVWVQGQTIVVLAASVAGGDADDAFALGAEHAPAVAASIPGEPVAPQDDGQQIQGVIVAVPLLIWLLLVLPARAVVRWRRPRYQVESADPHWRDITGAAAALTRRRGWRRAGWWVAGLGVTLALFGVLNTAFGEIADGVIRLLIGIAASVGGVAMIARNAPLPVERAGRLPTTRSGRAWLGTALSAVAYVLALAIVVAVGIASIVSVMLPPANRLLTLADILAAGSQAPTMTMIALGVLLRDALLPTLLGIVAALVAVAAIDGLGRRLRAASLRDVLLADPRPPVLYLRSFDEDRLTLPATLHRRGLMDTLNVVRRRRFEEAIVVQLQRQGPVVAIAPPGTRLPKVGAARASYAHDEWQERVTELAQRAAVVVLSATPDSVREGFGWEIDLVASRLHHGRVMVVVGPWRGHLKRRWEAFRSHVERLPFFTPLADAALPDGLLVAAHSTQWGWATWGATTRTDVTYAVAIDHALHALREDVQGLDDDPDAVDPLLASG